MSIVIEPISGTDAEKQYCHITRNMSLVQIKRVEDLSDNLLGESEFMHTARKLYKKILDEEDDDLYTD